MRRRLFAGIVALALVLTLLPVSVLAEEGAPQAVTVAKIGDTEYASLAEAVEAVSADASTTITMHENHTLSGALTIPAGKNIVLDLNGKTITYNSTTQGEAMITNMGTLTINDSASAQSGVINYNYTGAADPSYSKGNYTISNSGTLTVNGGKITIANLRAHAKYPINNVSANGDAVLVINGGHLYNYNTSAIRQICNSTTHKNSVTINGGLIEGFSAIWMQNPGGNTVHGSLSITGGEIRSTAAAYASGSSALKDVASHLYFTIDGAGGAWSEDSAANFSGGIFNENVDVGDNAPAVTIGTEAVFNGRIDPFVARIGNVIYETLADAVAAVPANTATTITMMEDVELAEKIVIPDGTKVVLDLNGQTIRQEKAQTEAYAMIVNNGTLTVKDSIGAGKISYKCTTVGGNYVSNTITNHGVLNIEGGTIESLSALCTAGYPHAIDVYPGSVTNITGGTVESEDYDAIRMFCNSAIEATTVNISGGNIINRISFQNPNNNTNSAGYGVLNITGGTFTTSNGVSANVRLLNFSTNWSNMKATVSGGTFDKGLVVSDYDNNTNTAPVMADWLALTGGTFSVDPTAYVADDYSVHEDAEGKFIVVPEYCTVTFNSDGGSAVDAQIVAYGAVASAPEAPTKADHTFAGWKLDGEAYDFATPVTAPITLVAQWNINQYTVTFDSNGGSAVEAQTVNHGGVASAPEAPTKADHTFAGWQLNGETYDFATPVTAPITLVAQWTANSAGSPGQSGNSGNSGSSSVPSGTVTPPPSSPSTPTPTVPDVTVPDAPKVDTSSPTVDTKTETTVDGSSVKTETKEDGTVVESVTKPDGASSTTATKTEVKENADGSTSTTTATNTSTTTADGSKVTEEKVEQKVENKDGSTTTTAATKTETTTAAGDKVTEEKVAETTENADGSFTFTVAAKTETVTADGKKETVVSEEKTTANADGSATKTTTVATQTEKKSETTVKEEKTVVNEDGTTTTTETAKTETALDNGSKGTTTVDETGKVEAKVEVTNKAVSEAAKSGETVALPMPEVPAAKSTESAPSVSINMPASAGTVKVEVPVENVGGGVVAVIVNADGSETVLTDTLPTENGISVPVEGNVEIKIVDKSTAFEDKGEVRRWAHKSMDFVSARGIMNGVGDGTTFAPNGTTTRAMVWTMLARLDGVETSGGRNWAAAGRNWAMENGISDGTNGDAEVTREQLATMLYRFMGSPAHDHEIDHFDDHHETSKWAREAKAWAVGNKVINGKAGDDGALTLDPTGDATRAEVSQMFMNLFVNVGVN